MLYIRKINGKHYLMTAEGYILHSENSLDDLWDYCKENFAATYAANQIKEV